MVNTTVQQWMSNEMERLSSKWQRYKPASSGYNRIHSARLSKSVSHMLNNPLPAEDRLGGNSTIVTHRGHQRTQVISQPQILSQPQSVWDEVYPTVQFKRQEPDEDRKSPQFAYYRNCATRVT